MELKIKQIRELTGLNQLQMAEKMNISQSAYARFELKKTNIDLERVEIFAKVVGMTVMDVITYPERFINIKDIANEINSNAEVILQIKVKKSKREEILKIVLGDENVELLK